ncbi:hypothetical protein [Sporolactobacillus terrae]|uniref:hypothetical protein n=1 Tax=Sporolactobacillus terrae TaxID=269673 RepID=UPI00048DE50C|nr:hypothetical protein [Sporolactobacillus terrae]UAK16759.1 hypothetical protein K7399_01980 [Sporolactobacillus terrae]
MTKYRIIGKIIGVKEDNDNKSQIRICATSEFSICTEKILPDKSNKMFNSWIPLQGFGTTEQYDCITKENMILPLPQTTWLTISSDKLSKFILDQYKSSTLLLFTMFYAGERNGYVIKGVELTDDLK